MTSTVNLWTNVPTISATPPESRHARDPKEGMADAHDAAKVRQQRGRCQTILPRGGHLMASRTGRLLAVMTLNPRSQTEEVREEFLLGFGDVLPTRHALIRNSRNLYRPGGFLL
jgi:hypothetical protein